MHKVLTKKQTKQDLTIFLALDLLLRLIDLKLEYDRYYILTFGYIQHTSKNLWEAAQQKKPSDSDAAKPAVTQASTSSKKDDEPKEKLTKAQKRRLGNQIDVKTGEKPRGKSREQKMKPDLGLVQLFMLSIASIRYLI